MIEDLTLRCSHLKAKYDTLLAEKEAHQDLYAQNQFKLENELGMTKVSSSLLIPPVAIRKEKGALEEEFARSNNEFEAIRTSVEQARSSNEAHLLTIHHLEKQVHVIHSFILILEIQSLNTQLAEKLSHASNLSQQNKELQNTMQKLQLAIEKQTEETAKPIELLVQETTFLRGNQLALSQFTTPETVNQQNQMIAQIKAENERLILTGRSEDFDKLSVATEILKREKIDLTSQLNQLSKMNDQLMGEKSKWVNRQNNVAVRPSSQLFSSSRDKLNY